MRNLDQVRARIKIRMNAKVRLNFIYVQFFLVLFFGGQNFLLAFKLHYNISAVSGRGQSHLLNLHSP